MREVHNIVTMPVWTATMYTVFQLHILFTMHYEYDVYNSTTLSISLLYIRYDLYNFRYLK
jgi:hypothetical protein